VRAYVGLGANAGDCVATLHATLAALARKDGMVGCAVSPFYRSAPIDAQGPDYINAVAALDTTLAPLELLDTLQALEDQYGRQRSYRHAPRTLDLDLLLYGNMSLHHARLTLPHPRMHERAFVLLPLHDLAPSLVLAQGALGDLLARVAHQTLCRILTA
jgi:2-amino-4-hydroxy-6-hydroxymethyldihydropteridine diphosphokinase